jgi:hypothetical protein
VKQVGKHLTTNYFKVESLVDPEHLPIKRLVIARQLLKE